MQLLKKSEGERIQVSPICRQFKLSQNWHMAKHSKLKNIK